MLLPLDARPEDQDPVHRGGIVPFLMEDPAHREAHVGQAPPAGPARNPGDQNDSELEIRFIYPNIVNELFNGNPQLGKHTFHVVDQSQSAQGSESFGRVRAGDAVNPAPAEPAE